MKKVYIKPTVETTELTSEVVMMVGSVNVVDPGTGGKFDSSEDDQYSNRRRGTWGNLWAEE